MVEVLIFIALERGGGVVLICFVLPMKQDYLLNHLAKLSLKRSARHESSYLALANDNDNCMCAGKYHDSRYHLKVSMFAIQRHHFNFNAMFLLVTKSTKANIGIF